MRNCLCFGEWNLCPLQKDNEIKRAHHILVAENYEDEFFYYVSSHLSFIVPQEGMKTLNFLFIVLSELALVTLQMKNVLLVIESCSYCVSFKFVLGKRGQIVTPLTWLQSRGGHRCLP